MIAIWNRKELAVTYSLKKQAEIRECLAQNGVEYTVKTVNRMASPPCPDPGGGTLRSRAGTLGQRPDLNYEYIIYVRRKEFEKAQHLLQKNGIR